MSERPTVVVTRTRRGETPTREFKFTEAEIPATQSPALRDFRQRAWQAFKSLPMPTTKEEAWRRTDIAALKADSFSLPSEGAYLDLPELPQSLLKPIAGQEHGGQVLSLPGGSKVTLDPALAAKGVVLTDFVTAQRERADLLDRLIGRVVKADEGKFGALAAAFSSAGVLLYVPRNVSIDQPLQSILWTPGAGLAHVSHVLVWVEDGASVTFVHEAASPENESGQSLHAGIVELHVGAGANLRFVELQSFGQNVWNFTHERAEVERDGTLEWTFGAIGSHLTKNFTDLELVGAGSTGKMSGFYFTNQDQHLDHDTQQNHRAPNTTSDLLFKGALQDNSRSVWQGMIYVAPGAAKTDGYQANRNLVLSSGARADSIPGLEILADDVRCTHGATVGKIDKDQVFYLRSRGIEPREAERLIVEGFFDPIMQRIPFEGVRERFQQAIHDKMQPQA